MPRTLLLLARLSRALGRARDAKPWSFALVVALVASACAPAPGAALPLQDDKVRVSDATRGELDAVLQKRVVAMERRDLRAFQATIDTTRGAFRRCQEEQFQVAGRRGALGPGTIVKVEPYLDTYARAYVGDRDGVQRFYFRRESGRWIFTEPKASELGGEKRKTVDGLELSHWGIDADIIDLLAREGLKTRDFLQKLARSPTRHPFALRFFPTRERAGILDCGIAGTHIINDPKDPFLRFYRVWLSPDLKEPSELMKGIIRHEGLHWLQDQFIEGITARLDWWLGEGWPDYIGSVPRNNRTVCGQLPTMKQMRDGPGVEQDLPPEISAAYYDWAHLMIEYFYERYGQDAFWDLMRAYKESVVAKDTYGKVLNTTPEQYYAEWLKWARGKFC